MKKILVLMLCIFMLCGCSNSAGMPNPTSEYSSLEEINEKADAFLVDIKECGEVTDEHFSVIDDKIAEYTFLIDGYDICFRCSKDMDTDISGLFVDGEPAFTDLSVMMAFGGDDETKAFRFVEGDYQYTITSKRASDPDDDLFLTYISLLSDKCRSSMTEDITNEMIGYYKDEAEETYAAVFLYGVNDPWLEISLYITDDEIEEWTMEMTHAKEGKYTFDEFAHYHFIYSDDSDIFDDYEELHDSTSGSIEYKDGKITFTDSNIEILKDIVLEKYE